MDSAVSTVIQPHFAEPSEQYELSSISIQQPESGQQTPASGLQTPISTPFTAANSQAALRAALDDGLNVQELAPVDRGVRAWIFCMSSFTLEMVIWGLCFR